MPSAALLSLYLDSEPPTDKVNLPDVLVLKKYVLVSPVKPVSDLKFLSLNITLIALPEKFSFMPLPISKKYVFIQKLIVIF